MRYLRVSLVAALALAACSEVPVQEVIDCDWQVLTFMTAEETTGIATGDWAVPALEYAPVEVDPKYSHQLSFMMSPMMPPMMDPIASSGPVILYADDFATMIVSPLNAFGSTWMLRDGGKLRIGMHGDTDRIPAGTEHRFLVVSGQGINHTTQCWGALMRREAGTTPPDRYADTGLSYLGYWTDNGAAYYYSTSGELNEQDTLLAVKTNADEIGVPYGYFQIDSWWYQKERQTNVNPGGLISWQPQAAMFPDGLAAFQDALGLPLVAHNRWVSIHSPYLDRFDFVIDDDPDVEMAVPTGPGLFEEFMQSCLDWGVQTYEQDWLMNQYFGSRWLRNEPGHLEQWLRNMHDSAAAAGLTTQICMTGGAHLMEAASHENVTTVRTTIDYMANVCKECFWPQFHINNMVAGALGVWPFKDNFHSGEPHGRAEALISSLSAGMVGMGDAIGTTVVENVMPACRADGLLLKPDRPATAIDPMYLPHARPFTVSTETTLDGAGEWIYLAAFNMASGHPGRTDDDRLWEVLLYDAIPVSKMFNYPESVTDWSFDMTRDIGRSGRRVLYDWKTGQASVLTDVFTLPQIENLNDFDYMVLAPIFANGLALIGEPDKYVTMADRRFKAVKQLKHGLNVNLEGTPGETVKVLVYDTTVDRMLPTGEATIGADGTATLTVGREFD